MSQQPPPPPGDEPPAPPSSLNEPPTQPGWQPEPSQSDAPTTAWAQAPESAPSGSDGQGSPRKRNRKKWIVGAVVVVLVLAAIGSSSRDKTDSQSGTQIANATSSPRPTDTTVEGVTPAETEPTTASEEPTEAATDPPIPNTLWTLDEIKDRTASYGFQDWVSSPLADGTPRWLVQRTSDSASMEAIGADENSIRTVSLVIGATADNGEQLGQLLGAFINTWAPGAKDDVLAATTNFDGSTLDETVPFDGGSVHIQGLATSDGVLLTTSIDREE